MNGTPPITPRHSSSTSTQEESIPSSEESIFSSEESSSSYDEPVSLLFISDNEFDTRAFNMAVNLIKSDRDGAIEILTGLADQGSVEACLWIAEHPPGSSNRSNSEYELFWYKKASDLGSVTAPCMIGNLYYRDFFGELGTTNENDRMQQAMSWYVLGASRGDASAMNNLGDLYRSWPAIRDYTQAKIWFEEARIKGDGAASNNLGYLYLNGFGVKKDYDQALIYMKESNKFGNGRAYHQLNNYQQFCDAEKLQKSGDYLAAEKIYASSGINEYPEANYQRACLYKDGYVDTPHKNRKIISLFEEAAKESPEACNQLGEIYLKGEILSKDIEKAIKWFEEAAKLGDSTASTKIKQIIGKALNDASVFLANKYYKEAEKIYNFLVGKRNSEAQYQLGMMYLKGQYVTKNKQQAESLLTKASSQGHGEASLQLAKMYIDSGRLGSNDEKIAHLFNLAFQQKNPDASVAFVNWHEDRYLWAKTIDPKIISSIYTDAANNKNHPAAIKWLQNQTKPDASFSLNRVAFSMPSTLGDGVDDSTL